MALESSDLFTCRRYGDESRGRGRGTDRTSEVNLAPSSTTFAKGKWGKSEVATKLPTERWNDGR